MTTEKLNFSTIPGGEPSGGTTSGEVPAGDAPEPDGRSLEERILGGLDAEQREVASTLQGPMCVLAGAGTGQHAHGPLKGTGDLALLGVEAAKDPFLQRAGVRFLDVRFGGAAAGRRTIEGLAAGDSAEIQILCGHFCCSVM